MKRYFSIWVLSGIVILCLLSLETAAQRLSQYEYWFDDNVSDRTNRAVTATSALTTIADSINITSLQTGLHVLSIRLGTSTQWSATTTQFFYKSAVTSSGLTISEIDYWFDDNTAARTSKAINGASPNGVVMDSVNIQALSNGLHRFNMRLNTTSGWTSPTSDLFYKLSADATGVSAIEYWLNNDFANRKTKNIALNTEGVVLDSLDLTTVCKGQYFIYSRYRTRLGWSSVTRDTFNKTKYAPTEAQADFIFRISDNKDYTVHFTDSSKNYNKHLWTFGNGQRDSILINPTHRYSAAGIYNVCKQVRKNLVNTGCDTDTLCQTVLMRGVNSFYPNEAANSGYFIANITGFGFTPNTRVELFKGAETLTTVELIFNKDPNLRANFRFINATNGLWSLRVIVGRDTFLKPNVLNISSAKPLDFNVNIVAPPTLLRGRFFNFDVQVTNKSNRTAFAVPVYISLNGLKDVMLKTSVVDTHPTLSAARVDSLKRFFSDSTQFYAYRDSLTGDSVKFALLAIPYLEPNQTFSIKLAIRSNDFGDLKLEAWVGNSLMDSAALRRFGLEGFCAPFENECHNEMLNAALGAAGFVMGLVPLGVTQIASAAISLRSLGCTVSDIVNGQQGDMVNIGFDIYGAVTSMGGVWGTTGKALKNAVSNAIGKTSKGVVGSTGPSSSGIIGGQASMINDIRKLIDKCNPPMPLKKDESNAPTRNSSDPNLKVGPQGRNALNCVTGDDLMPYTIYFENADTATAPASEVSILDQLDTSKFDLSTLQFTGFGFGDSTYSLPPQYGKAKSFIREVDLRPRKNIILRVTGEMDVNGQIKWYFASFDPRTMDLTQNIENGFLPPNRLKPEGEGFVSFRLKPKSGLPHLTSFRNKADIVFDYNAPIPTPVWINTIDRVAPISRVMSVVQTAVDSILLIRWSGSDAQAGVMDYSIYVSENGGAFESLLSNISLDSIRFIGTKGKKYSFYSTARDYVGNIETKSPVAEVTSGRVPTLEVSVNTTWLGQNRPNPFSNTTSIPFYLSTVTKNVSLSIINLDGKVLQTYTYGEKSVGEHTVDIQVKDLPVGLYFYRLTADDKFLTKRMVVTR